MDKMWKNHRDDASKVSKTLIIKTSRQVNIIKFSVDSVDGAKFYNCLKLVKVIPVFRKTHAHLKLRHTNKYIYCQTFLNFLRASFVSNFQHFLMAFFQSIDVVTIECFFQNRLTHGYFWKNNIHKSLIVAL